MKKHLISILVLFLLLSTSFVGVSNRTKQASIDTNKSETTTDIGLQNSSWPSPTIPALKQQGTCVNGTDFSTNISGPSFWMVIKMTFSQRANISFEHNGFYSYNHSAFGYFIEAYTLADFQDYISFFNACYRWGDPEVYCHIGSLNWSFAHNKSQDFSHYGTEHFTGAIKGNGSYYIVFISYATNRSLSVNIHSNVSGSFAVEWGDTVFALDRDDFLGGVNVGWRRGVCIINAQRTLDIKHCFFGFFDTMSCSGYSLLSYQTPDGTSYRRFTLDFLGRYLFTSNLTHLDSGLVWGQSGTWRFHATMIYVALLKLSPRVYLAGADICLPS